MATLIERFEYATEQVAVATRGKNWMLQLTLVTGGTMIENFILGGWRLECFVGQGGGGWDPHCRAGIGTGNKITNRNRLNGSLQERVQQCAVWACFGNRVLTAPRNAGTT